MSYLKNTMWVKQFNYLVAIANFNGYHSRVMNALPLGRINLNNQISEMINVFTVISLTSESPTHSGPDTTQW